MFYAIIFKLVEIIKSLPENKVAESAECVEIMSQFNVKENVTVNGTYSVAARCAENIHALCVFGRLSTTLRRFLQGSPAVFNRLIHTSANVVCVAFDGNQKGDEQNLSQFMQLVLFSVYPYLDFIIFEFSLYFLFCKTIAFKGKTFYGEKFFGFYYIVINERVGEIKFKYLCLSDS